MINDELDDTCDSDVSLDELDMEARRTRKNSKKIDRSQENERVLAFQRTGDGDVLNSVYKERIPTIEHLAGQYSWITEDISSELLLVFMKSIHGYGEGHTDFNTFFYTNVLNRMRNMIKRKYRKKRTVEGNPSMTNIFVNLDDCVPTDEGLRYHEIIPDEKYNVAEEIRYAEMISVVAAGNKIIEDLLFLITYSNRSEFDSRCHRLMYSCENNGGGLEDTIRADIDLPEKLYVLLDYDYDNFSIIYEVAVCGRLAFAHIARIANRILGPDLG